MRRVVRSNLVLAALVLATSCQADAAPTRTGPRDPSSTPPPVTATSDPGHESRDDLIALARRKIDHVVYLIKENRTFDHMYGRFPGADGARTGRGPG